MALEPGPDPLDRALEAARAEEPDGWNDLSQSIMSRVRSVVTPSYPVLAYSNRGEVNHDDAGSRTRVSSRIINRSLRTLLQQPTVAPVGIDLEVADERLEGVSLSLVCSYGVDLVALGDAVRAEVLAELVAVLGPDPDFTVANIHVHIKDVVVGDPNLV